MFTNAGKAYTLSGQFTSLIVNPPFIGLELDWSKGIYLGSLSVRETRGLQFSGALLQTNTFRTKTNACGPPV
jgi:hypothetical protein